MSHRASGSSYHRLVQCAFWARLDVSVTHQPSGAAARIGTAAHDIVDAALRGAPSQGLPEELEAAPIARQALTWLSTQPAPYASEVAIIYDAATDTARKVEPTGPREYGTIGPMEIPTTLDLVWLHDDDTITIRDLKTGKKPAHMEQLYIQALAATRLYGKRRAKVGFLWARKTKCDADPLEELDASALEAESWRAASVLRRLPVAQPVAGDACWWCPAKPSCPAHQQPNDDDRMENVNA